MFFEDFTVGMPVAIPPVTLTQEEIVSFARRYDDLPLHTDAAYAATTRFGGIIASGIHSYLALWGRVLETGVLGAELVAGTACSIRWLSPVYPEDTLQGTCTVSRLTEHGADSGEVEFTLKVKNQCGETAFVSTTAALVLRRK